MSHPAIYIALRGTTPHVRPRYIRPRPPRPRSAVPNHMVRYSGTPIRHTEFGIRKLEIRNPRAPSMERYPASMERYRTFFPSPALFLLTTEHGAVGFHPT